MFVEAATQLCVAHFFFQKQWFIKFCRSSRAFFIRASLLKCIWLFPHGVEQGSSKNHRPTREISNWFCTLVLTFFVNVSWYFFVFFTLSWRRPLSYRNQPTDLQSKSMDWFLDDKDLQHERVKWGLHFLNNSHNFLEVKSR